MNDQTKILVALLALFAADSVCTRRSTRLLARRFFWVHKAQRNRLLMQHEQIQYLSHLLIEHEIEIDEFDLIALSFNTEE